MSSSTIGSDSHTQVHPTTDEDAARMAMCLATWSVPSMVFKTILELNVIDIIHAAGPKAQLSAEQIVAQLPTCTNPHAAVSLDRMLRLLASFSIFTFTQLEQPDGSRPKRLYGLSPVCKFFAKNDDEVSYAAFTDLIHDKVIMDTWKNLKDEVLDGETTAFEKNYGTGVFDYLGTDSRFFKVFYTGMDHHSTIVMKKILDSYEFDGIKTLVDVGGATGLTLNMIRAKYPSIKGINFDLPHVIRDAPCYPGVEQVGGDMYESVPKGDAIFMKWTFLTGNDEQGLKLLKNCYKALPKDGKLTICEYVVPESPKTSCEAQTAFIWDSIMMTFPGGRARTKHEYEALGKEAGFEAFRVVCSACDTWVMEYLKENKCHD